MMLKTKYFSKDNITTEIFVKQRLENISKCYNLIKRINKGVHGSVYLIEHKTLKQKRCLKLFSKSYNKKKSKDTFENELNISKSLDHPFIIKTYEWIEDKLFYYIIMEYLEGGELIDYIKKKKINEYEIQKIIKNLLSGINYLHKKKIIHRDLKLQNIMLKKKMDLSSIKIIDFGISIKFEKETDIFHEPVGTDYYMAPELIQKHYNKKIDIWSLGVILYILICGYVPFDGEDYIDIFKKICYDEVEFEGEKWKGISEEAEELIYLMLMKNPDHRISIDGIFKHEWFDLENNNKKNKNLKIKEIFNYDNFRFIKVRTLIEKTLRLYIIKNFDIWVNTKNLRKIFTEIDDNHDGVISKDEFEKFFKKNNKFRKFENFYDFDFSKRKNINYSDFLIATVDFKKLIDVSNIHDVFDEIDTDKNGYLSMEELKTFLSNSGNNELLYAIMNETDISGDKRISFCEFLVGNNLPIY